MRTQTLKKKLTITLCTFAILVGTVVPAIAAVSYPGGGTWSYGTRGSGTEVYSDYHHPSRRHRSSVINYWGEYKSSGCKSPNVWARASLRAKPGGVDRSYWSNSC